MVIYIFVNMAEQNSIFVQPSNIIIYGENLLKSHIASHLYPVCHSVRVSDLPNAEVLTEEQGLDG